MEVEVFLVYRVVLYNALVYKMIAVASQFCLELAGG